MKRTIVGWLGLVTMVWAAGLVVAGSLDIQGDLSVSSNLTAQTVTLGGQTRSNWPSAGVGSAVNLGHTPFLAGPKLGFYSIVLTNHANWNFGEHAEGWQFKLKIAQDAVGGRTNVWPADVRWPDNQVSMTTTQGNRWDVLEIVDDGTYYNVVLSSLNFRGSHHAVSSQNVNARVKIGNVSLSGVGALTIEYWAKLRPVAAPYQVEGGTILALNHNVGSSGVWSDTFLWCGNQIWDYIVVFGGPSSNENYRVHQPTAVMMDGGWHHVAGVYNGSEYRLYLDGALQGTISATIDLPAAMDVWVLAHDWFNVWNEHVNGTMDEVRVSKVVRYTSNFTPAHPFAADGDTLLYLRFNEGTGTSYTDETGNTIPVYVGNPPEWVEGR